MVGLRLGPWHRPNRRAAARDSGHPHVLGERPPRPEAVRMKVPRSWLREYVPVDVPTSELAERLFVTTCEVEGIERRGVADLDGNLALFRVGRVLEAAKHPNPHPHPRSRAPA